MKHDLQRDECICQDTYIPVKEMLTSLEVFKQKVSPSKKFNLYLVVVGVEILEDVDADDDKELDVDTLKTMM